MQVDNLSSIYDHMNNFNQNAQKIAEVTTHHFDANDVQPNQDTQNIQNAQNTSHEDLSRVLTDNISLENGFDAQIKSIQTQNQVLGGLFDIRG